MEHNHTPKARLEIIEFQNMNDENLNGTQPHTKIKTRNH